MFKPEQKAYIEKAKSLGVIYGDATRLPLKNNSMDLVYSCHTVEHLYEEDFLKFLQEADRVLKPDGIFRMVIPDLSLVVKRYLETGNADEFCETLHMSDRHKPTFADKIALLLFGNRKHKWMYDGESMKKYLETHSNFNDVRVLKPGETTIKGDPKINLREYEGPSVYFECRRRREKARS